MPEDIAITSNKSDVDPCSNGRETDRQKSADGRTDGFSAYIVDCYCNLWSVVLDNYNIRIVHQ